MLTEGHDDLLLEEAIHFKYRTYNILSKSPWLAWGAPPLPSGPGKTGNLLPQALVGCPQINVLNMTTLCPSDLRPQLSKTSKLKHSGTSRDQSQISLHRRLLERWQRGIKPHHTWCDVLTVPFNASPPKASHPQSPLSISRSVSPLPSKSIRFPFRKQRALLKMLNAFGASACLAIHRWCLKLNL